MKRLFALLVTLAPSVAFATTYVVGTSNYNVITGSTQPYTTAMHVSGTFTTANPLAPNLLNVDIGSGVGGNQLLGWNFNDGVNTYTQTHSALLPFSTSSNLFSISTDSAGNPIGLFAIIISPSAWGPVGEAVNGIVFQLPFSLNAQTDNVCSAIVGGTCHFIIGPNWAAAGANPVTFTITRQAEIAAVAAPAGHFLGWLPLAITLIGATWRHLRAATMSFGMPEFRSIDIEDKCSCRLTLFHRNCAINPKHSNCQRAVTIACRLRPETQVVLRALRRSCSIPPRPRYSLRAFGRRSSC